MSSGFSGKLRPVKETAAPRMPSDSIFSITGVSRFGDAGGGGPGDFACAMAIAAVIMTVTIASVSLWALRMTRSFIILSSSRLGYSQRFQLTFVRSQLAEQSRVECTTKQASRATTQGPNLGLETTDLAIMPLS